MTRLSRSALIALVAALWSFAAACPASAQISDDEALAAIQAVEPDFDAISDRSASHDGTRDAVVAQHIPDADLRSASAVWLVGPGGAIKLADQWDARMYGPSIGTPVWSPDDRWILAAELPNGYTSRFVTELWRTGQPSISTRINDTAGGFFTRDSRYAALTVSTSTSLSTIGDSVLDLASGRYLVARSAVQGDLVGPPDYAYAPECARSQEPDWRPAVYTGTWLPDVLAGPDPGCRFGANENEPGPASKPSPTPTPTPTPSPAASALGSLQPSSATLPPVTIVSVSGSLRSARGTGVRVKVALAGPAESLKGYVVVAGGSASAYRAAAGANADLTLGRCALPSDGGTVRVAIPLTRAAKRALRRTRQIDVTVRLVATTAAGASTVTEQPVRLIAR